MCFLQRSLAQRFWKAINKPENVGKDRNLARFHLLKEFAGIPIMTMSEKKSIGTAAARGLSDDMVDAYGVNKINSEVCV